MQPGGNTLVFGGDLLADFSSGLLTPATHLVAGFEHRAFHFQWHSREGLPAPVQEVPGEAFAGRKPFATTVSPFIGTEKSLDAVLHLPEFIGNV